jgi:signal transduction histidine kinase
VRTDLNAFVQRSLNSVIVPPGIQVNIESLTGDPMAMIDQEQMIQVLTNLERNAIEAMPEQGLLNIALEGNDREVQIRISDTGTGISEENKEKLFTPFFTTKEPGKGTGLGLPLVYGIVKMHRGKISVNSNTDPAKGPTGTEFIISLPRNDF